LNKPDEIPRVVYVVLSKHFFSVPEHHVLKLLFAGTLTCYACDISSGLLGCNTQSKK